MDVSDIRRLQMRLIIDQRFNGKQSAFAAAIERQPDYVSRCLKGTKRIGEEFAGHVERQLGLPDGWMSGVHGVDSLESSRLPAIAEPEPSYLIEASRIIQVPKLAVAASTTRPFKSLLVATNTPAFVSFITVTRMLIATPSRAAACQNGAPMRYPFIADLLARSNASFPGR